MVHCETEFTEYFSILELHNLSTYVSELQKFFSHRIMRLWKLWNVQSGITSEPEKAEKMSFTPDLTLFWDKKKRQSVNFMFGKNVDQR